MSKKGPLKSIPFWKFHRRHLRYLISNFSELYFMKWTLVCTCYKSNSKVGYCIKTLLLNMIACFSLTVLRMAALGYFSWRLYIWWNSLKHFIQDILSFSKSTFGFYSSPTQQRILIQFEILIKKFVFFCMGTTWQLGYFALFSHRKFWNECDIRMLNLKFIQLKFFVVSENSLCYCMYFEKKWLLTW